MLTMELIRQAREHIAPFINRTPIATSRSFNRAAGREVFFKCENLQRAGAFKFRGAMNKIGSLSAEEKARGVVAFSSGNHAQAVALASREPACERQWSCRTTRRSRRSPRRAITGRG
jgi:threonine dehydratase